MTGQSASSSRPSILWISTHDINPHLGAYAGVYPGAQYARTPNLDRLAAQGARFDNAFAAAPICAPSRSAIMTGCFPTAVGTMHMRTKAVPPPEVRLLPEYFRQAGYYVTNNWFTDFQVAVPLSAFDDCGETAHWRNRPDPDQPFFATFHGMATHESQIYLDDDAFAARTAHVTEADRHEPAKAPLPPYYPDTDVFRRSWARYNDLITEMDHWVGQILAELDADGLAANTIVVFWSDHGPGMPRAKRWANDSGLHEPLIIRWPGKIPAGTVAPGLVHLMDLAPSMLAACRLPVPGHMHGRPFLTPDGDIRNDVNEYLFAGRDRMGELEDMSRTVRDRRFRYIRHFHPDRSPMQHCDYPDRLGTWAEMRRLAQAEAVQLAQGRPRSALTPLQRSLVAACKPAEELYDIAADPYETINLAPEPGYRDVLQRFRAELQRWQDAHGDLGRIPEDDLIEQWRPGGAWPVTEPPQLGADASGALVVTVATEGASLIWTPDEPEDELAAPPSGNDQTFGAAAGDHRRWHLLCTATPPPAGRPYWVRATRLGYLPSAAVRVPGTSPAPRHPLAGGSGPVFPGKCAGAGGQPCSLPDIAAPVTTGRWTPAPWWRPAGSADVS